MSFVFPLGLLLAGLALPILAMYFLRIRRKKVVVPSLLLWHALQKQDRRASPFDRFRKHLLLLLQLLLLALIVLALARPYLETEASAFRSIVLLVDTSASMNATDGSPTRLDDAKAKANTLLAALGPSDEAMLITAGPRTEVRVPFTRDAAELSSVLDRISATQAEGSLRDGLQLALSLAQSRPDVEIVVLSDGGNDDLSSLQTNSTAISYVRLGHRSNNAGILALDLRRSPVSELDRQLFLTVGAFGSAPVETTIELYLDDQLVGLRNERLAPGEPVSMVFELEGARTGVLRAHLDTPDDLLPTDNDAFAVLGEVASRAITLVGSDALTARVLAADPRVQLRRLSPDQATSSALQSADAVFFLSGEPPPKLDGMNIALLSRKVKGPAQLGVLTPLPEVVSWERTHPLNRFVDYQGATIARAATVVDRGGLVPILSSDSGPLLLAGEQNGGRVLQFAFDPFESDLPMRVAWPVLLLNTVGWLTERAGGSSAAILLPTGHPLVRPMPGHSGEATLTGPAGTTTLSLSGGVLRVIDTDQIGIYKVRVQNTTLAFAANLLSRHESRITPARALSLSTDAPIEARASIRPGRRELWRPLSALALLMMLIEWWAWNRRKTA